MGGASRRCEEPYDWVDNESLKEEILFPGRCLPPFLLNQEGGYRGHSDQKSLLG